MLTNNTLDGLHTLKLPGMARGLLEQREHPDYDPLGFEERLGMLVDRELTERANRRLERMLKAAHLRLSASIEGIDFSRPRGLERAQILSLAEAHWVVSHHSILIVAATGLGKTYISCALANAAVRRGHSALYLRGPRLHDEIALARADGRLPRLMAAWARTDVLLVDDFLLRPLAPDQAADLLEVIEDRVGRRSTLVTSQLPVAMWHEALGVTRTIFVHCVRSRVAHVTPVGDHRYCARLTVTVTGGEVFPIFTRSLSSHARSLKVPG